MLDDKRRSYRYAAQPDFAPAKLRIGSKCIEAKLVNESAGGFSFETSYNAPVGVGQTIEVVTYSGTWETEVVHVQEEDDCLRLGVKRCFDNPSGAGHSRTISFELVLLMTVIAASGAMLASWLHGDFSLTPKPAIAASEPPLPRPAPPVSIPVEFAEQALDRRAALALAGVNSLTDPEVAAMIKLTGEQKQALGQTFAKAEKSLTTLYDQTKGSEPERWATESNRIVEHTLEQVLWTLSDEQILLWRSELARTVFQPAAKPQSSPPL